MPPCDTVNVTVPAFTVPLLLVTVAESATFWLLVLKVAKAFVPVVVVGEGGVPPLADLKAANAAPQLSAVASVAVAADVPADV